jgi:integration host factor subunit beta
MTGSCVAEESVARWGKEVLMKKSDLVEAIAEKEGIPFKVAGVCVDTLFDAMTEALVKGDRIEIRGFGTFVAKKYAGHKGRNPKTGEPVAVPPKRLPAFKTGKELKERVNKGKAG